MTNKQELTLIVLNGICEDALDAARDDPALNLEAMLAYESQGMEIPPFLRLAVMEFVFRNATFKDYPDSKKSNVYFIKDKSIGAVKIGFSSASKIRISQIQCHNSGSLELLGVIPGGREKEKELHKKFKHLKMRGEWFVCGDDLMAYIDQAIEDGGQHE